jgi:hypothetical protein
MREQRTGTEDRTNCGSPHELRVITLTAFKEVFSKRSGENNFENTSSIDAVKNDL